MENVPEPLTRKYNLRANPVQGNFVCYWEDKFAGKANPVLSLAMTALNKDENDALGLEEEKYPFQGILGENTWRFHMYGAIRIRGGKSWSMGNQCKSLRIWSPL